MFRCVSVASVSVLVNGIPWPVFQIERGFRQGYPLSPLFFNLLVIRVRAFGTGMFPLGGNFWTEKSKFGKIS